MRDNHLHTYFSYDSETDFEPYLEHYEGEIVTTEHFDLSNPVSGQDDIPNYQAYSEKIAQLNKTYGNRIKRGIEIGYFAPREADILAFLEGKDYDLKLLSVHHNGRFDYMDDCVCDMDRDQVITAYFSELEAAIGRVPAHVLAHFDYGLRKLQLTVADLQAYQADLLRIFQKMSDLGLAFELNSKSMYLYGNEDLYRYALGLVRSLGGQRFSIGSDGHKLEHFRLAFDKIEALLAEFDIKEEELLS